MVLLNRNELCELCHIVLHRDDLQHNTAEVRILNPVTSVWLGFGTVGRFTVVCSADFLPSDSGAPVCRVECQQCRKKSSTGESPGLWPHG